MSKSTGQKDLSLLTSNHNGKNNNRLTQNDVNDSDDDLVKGTLDIEYEEDELEQDWSEVIKLNKKHLQMIIPKRGEKDYEPDGTDIQELLLYKARKAMFDALSNSVRGTTIKNQVKAVYDFNKHKALVLNPKGSFLQTMGHITNNGEFWLDFMEFLYLAERGTITPYCLKSNSIALDQTLSPNDDNNLLPLSIEDIYAFFKTQRELDEFSVYAHLKRLGFIVTKVVDDEDKDNNTVTFYPKVKTFKSVCGCQLHSLFKQVTSLFVSHKNNLFNGLFYNQSHYKYIKYTSTPQIYQNLKLLIPHVEVPKTLVELQHRKQNYLSNKNQGDSNDTIKLTFNVWKPQTNYKKKIPELPDYQMVVYNKNDNKQHFPTNDDFKRIFDSLNYKFEFLDNSNDNVDTINWDDHSYINGITRSLILSKNQKKRKSNSQTETKSNIKDENRKKLAKQSSPLASFSSTHVKQTKRLKNGYRSFILAVMDNGIISFIKISEADFGSENVWYVPTSPTKKIKKAQYQYKKRNIIKQNNKDQKA